MHKRMTKWLSALVIALLLAGSSLLDQVSRPAEAAGARWYVKVNGSDSAAGDSWNTAFASLQKAIDMASSGDEVWIAQGTYYPTVASDASDQRTRSFRLKAGVAVYGGFTGTDDRETVDSRNWFAHQTIFSGDLDRSGDLSAGDAYHVFENSGSPGETDPAVLDGATIIGGNATGTLLETRQGGGIVNRNGFRLDLDNVIITGNYALQAGGGMGNYDGSIVSVTETLIWRNRGNFGGGMENASGAEVTLDQVGIWDNDATNSGGGLHNKEATVDIIQAEITGNKSVSFAGGGMYNDNARVTITGSRLHANTANTGGGGIFTRHSNPGVQMKVAYTEFRNNTAQSGGGVDNSGGTTSFTNVLFAGNRALGDGGAVHNRGGIVSFDFTTIAGNRAANGGSLFYGTTASGHVVNSIVWGNSTTLHTANPAGLFFRYSLVEGSGSSGASWKSSFGEDLDGNLDINPQFLQPVSASNAPTLAGNYRLKSSSPAIDAGDDMRLGIIAADLDGEPRKQHAHVDMGAYERNRAEESITDVENPDDLIVAVGTDRSELALPDMVPVTLSDETMQMISVMWLDEYSDYEPDVPGTYEIRGYLVEPGGGVRNLAGLEALIRVIVINPPVPIPDPDPDPAPVPPSSPAPPFTDMAGHWAEADVVAAADAGLVNGFPDDTFRPDTHITRLQFALILVRALGLTGEGSTITFTDRADVPDWAAAELALAVKHDVVHGYDDGSFRPDAIITRAEVAAMVAKALGLDLNPAAPPFADSADIPDWARPYVTAVQAAGLMQGQGGNRFVPAAPATRAEAATLLLRVWQRLND